MTADSSSTSDDAEARELPKGVFVHRGMYRKARKKRALLPGQAKPKGIEWVPLSPV